MSTPGSSFETGIMQHPAAPAAAADEENDMSAIPRRTMRVKVLYTFDDQNKSNCLTRLPNALNVPVVSLDENTQVGVIELKTCIQAIVAASPELVGKLGHDYTVYAYDYSEYETPLVGQGMLSWILASASSTPNAPADESKTMVTGRVCKNMLGLFGQGMKETLEVKLKLVPVPTSMQQEYVENMERYHSLSQIMPEGFDYSAWSDFLRENPMLGQLAQPAPHAPMHASQRSSIGGVEALHQMLTRNSPSQEPMRTGSFYDPSNVSFNAHSTRASSPAMSTLSFHHYQHNPESRPASRTSVRSEAALPVQSQQLDQAPTIDPYTIEQQEDGPPRKRARITQAKRPKNTPITAHKDSLRVTASTAASVRLHRPSPSMPIAALAAADSIPRAPTPRPGDASFGHRGSRRPPAPSALRHASMDEGRPYMSPYETNTFSDNAMETDDERGESPGDTPMDIPSSPPVATHGTASPDPSSPNLPTLSLPADSGFVSDMPLGHDEDSIDLGSNIWDGSDLPVPSEARTRRPPDRSNRSWQHVNPGPVDRLPQSYVPRPKQHHRKPENQIIAESIEQIHGGPPNALQHISVNMSGDAFPFPQQEAHEQPPFMQSQSATRPNKDRSLPRPAATDSCPFGPTHQQNLDMSQGEMSKGSPPTGMGTHTSPLNEPEPYVYSRSATPNLPPPRSKPAKTKGLARSQTWSGVGEPMSDAPGPSDQALPRSGSGARRKKYIQDKMQQAIAAGELPPHCKNCGEIDTPTWRKAYTRVELGSPDSLEVSTDTTSTGVIAYEVIEPTEESGGELSYRVFKNNVTREEKDCNAYESFNLCNPCGLWLIKKGAMRPRKLWDKSERGSKRKRQATAARAQSTTYEGEPASDAFVPHSEPVIPEEMEMSVDVAHGMTGTGMAPPAVRSRAASFQANGAPPKLEKDMAEEALRRAIQSSPAGLRGSRHSPINIDPDLTPKPTRRLLFPSPRKDGEVKLLAAASVSSAVPESIHREEPQEKPRCQRCKRLRKGCDRERPCQRCDNAGIGYEGCIPCEMPRTNWFETPTVGLAVIEDDNADKENCPPPVAQEHDELAHLFEDPVSPKTTPKKDTLFQDLLKTPTPGSRQRNALTPKRGADSADFLTTPSRMTPSRNMLTPRGTRAATIAPETPFTRQLNALLSEGNFSSPSQGIDFSSFPTFNTPGRHFSDFMNDDFLSSDMPMPSSPPKSGALGIGFDLYEDPNTSTMGLWSGASMFGSDAILEIENGSKRPSIDATEAIEATAVLKMNVGGITVDFASMIEEVVGAENTDKESDKDMPGLVEVESQGLSATPDAPTAE